MWLAAIFYNIVSCHKHNSEPVNCNVYLWMSTNQFIYSIYIYIYVYLSVSTSMWELHSSNPILTPALDTTQGMRRLTMYIINCLHQISYAHVLGKHLTHLTISVAMRTNRSVNLCVTLWSMQVNVLVVQTQCYSVNSKGLQLTSPVIFIKSHICQQCELQSLFLFVISTTAL